MPQTAYIPDSGLRDFSLNISYEFFSRCAGHSDYYCLSADKPVSQAILQKWSRYDLLLADCNGFVI